MLLLCGVEWMKGILDSEKKGRAGVFVGQVGHDVSELASGAALKWVARVRLHGWRATKAMVAMRKAARTRIKSRRARESRRSWPRTRAAIVLEKSQTSWSCAWATAARETSGRGTASPADSRPR